jgi:hypothetical protein
LTSGATRCRRIYNPMSTCSTTAIPLPPASRVTALQHLGRFSSEQPPTKRPLMQGCLRDRVLERRRRLQDLPSATWSRNVRTDRIRRRRGSHPTFPRRACRAVFAAGSARGMAMQFPQYTR